MMFDSEKSIAEATAQFKQLTEYVVGEAQAHRQARSEGRLSNSLKVIAGRLTCFFILGILPAQSHRSSAPGTSNCFGP